MKLILGLTGQMASGKGTVASYAEKKYSASTFRFSTMLRDVLDRLYIEKSRSNLQKISQVLRENFGEDTLAKVIAKDVENSESQIVVVDGVRRPDDVKYLKNIPGFVLVHVHADMQKRYDRIKVRTENTDDKGKTFEEFQEEHKGEAEQKIDEIAGLATEEIDNNGSIEDLYKLIDVLISKYGDKN